MYNFDAVIFDLDGVITQTALVHGSAWRKMFNEYLRSREERFGEPYKEFTHADDYLPYVDGKPRYKGVASFLESRGIDIPFGDPSDGPELETICSLGNRKNLMFNEVLDEEGAQVYDTSVSLLHALKKAGIRIGVASSSKNCKPVLEKAGLLHLFETRIDGVVSAEIGLQGKPEPDIFTTACDRLGVEYHRSVVVEDAVSGVQAGRNGNFGLVIGVAREENLTELQVNGGDIVVEDLGEISLERIDKWFTNGMEEDTWCLDYFDYDQSKERSREALLTVGNGYFGTRGAMEESSANSVNYPGTYISGLFNRRTSKVAGRDLENEDFVNISNWLPIRFRIEGEPWFEFSLDSTFRIQKMHRQLDMKSGLLTREMVVVDSKGRETSVKSVRLAGMHNEHMAGLSYSLTPLNYTENLRLESSISAKHINAGVERYKQLDQHHLEPVSVSTADGQLKLLVKTTQSDIEIAMTAKHIIAEGSGISRSFDTVDSTVREQFSWKAKIGREFKIVKLASIFTSLPNDSKQPMKDALSSLKEMISLEEEIAKSKDAWMKIWDEIDVRVEGDRKAQNLIRLHLYHMMVTASPHHAKMDAGIPPRGLHGEAYRGHIFWDELYILPLYNIHYPEVSKSVLMYRYNRIGKAREYAHEYGYEGAMFPWQSGSDGREETQIVHLNPLSGEWGDDYSSLQRHISLAIAYNVWNYFIATDDRDFMLKYGLELYLDICKFWISKTKLGESDGRYHIDKVMGPDEFHEQLPGSDVGGVTDNAYTNIMVSWMLSRVNEYLEVFGEQAVLPVLQRIDTTKSHLDHWNKVERLLALNIDHDGIVEQFQGYFTLKEVNWDSYRDKYDDLHRMDRILKAEGKSPDDYKLAKQADFLMTFYNLGNEAVTKIIQELGYAVPGDYITRNFDYYIARTSHGSTLSRLVHARLAYQAGLIEIGWELYMEALESDLIDIQGGTTGEGVHCGVMAGTVFDTLVSYGGLSLTGVEPSLCPSLPQAWKSLQFRFIYRAVKYNVTISESEIEIIPDSAQNKEIKVHICGEEICLENGVLKKIKYK
ncbi:beta-phosphoglucomutase family hydrolase [Bacteroidota bacterium]